MSRDYNYCARPVSPKHNERVPVDFLDTVIDTVRGMTDDVFQRNANPADIYSSIRSRLGPADPTLPWVDLLDRRAALCEVARVTAAWESDFDWNEGHDTTNPAENNPRTMSAGAFQVSADSLPFDPSLPKCLERRGWATDPVSFRRAMMKDHALAVEYFMRLVRFRIDWDGPIKRHEIHPYLNRDAKEEFKKFLA